MKVLISLRAHRPKTQGGMGDYIDGLIRGLDQLALRKQGEIYLLTTFFNHHLYENNFIHLRRIMLKNPGNYFQEIDEWVSKLNPDVIFFPLPYPVSELLKKTNLVTCIQDLQHEYYKQFFPIENLTLRYRFYDESAIYSKRIITLSEHSKSTISHIYHIRPERIDVISPALDETVCWEPMVTHIEHTLNKYWLTPDYLFYPANFWPHKNHEILFRSLQTLRSRGIKGLKLVLTGQPPPNQQDYHRLVSKYRVKDQVIHLGYVDRTDMPSLYWGALALVFPSFFEGFGIPILEAFKTKCPVIAARVTSIPEIARDGALYFDPEDETTLTHHILTIIENLDVRQELLLKGIELVNQFSYQSSAEKLWETFEKALQPERIEIRELPKVSIVTPSFNHAKFLRQTIDSVLQQDYPLLEYWVIDGGSTDGTLEILKSYGKRINWVSEKDKGQTQAINKGFSRCTGVLFSYLNSDDVLYPRAVWKVIEQCMKHPEVSIFYGGADWIDEIGNLIGPYNGGPFTFENLRGHCIICQPASFFTSLLYRRLGGFDENRSYAMDYDFWLKAATRGFQFLYLEEKLAASRLHSEAKTLLHRFEIHREIFGLQKEIVGYVHPQWIMSFSNFLKNEWRWTGGINHFIPWKVWYGFLKFSHHSLPKFQQALLSKGKGWAKTIGKKVFGFYQSMGAGFDGNWVGPDLKLKFFEPKRIGSIELGGEAFFPLILRVFINKKWIHTQDVGKGEFTLHIPLGSQPVHHIRIKANHCIKPFPPIVDKKISYRLNWCNFFDDLSFPIPLVG